MDQCGFDDEADANIGGSGFLPKTFNPSKCIAFERCNEPLDAISSNKSQDKIVVAGSRGILKIYGVTDDDIVQLLDLRQWKRRSALTYAPSNVAWSKVKEDVIATTSTNGAVVIWNVVTSKIETTYKVHSRSATVCQFHRYDENLLISGSKDGHVQLYDLRIPDGAALFTDGNVETIRDLAFCMHEQHANIFLSADEGGYLKIWDMRRSDRPFSAVQAHQGLVSSIALNPSEPNCVASGGGRDKRIKIWNWRDIDNAKKNDISLYGVETAAPVGRVYWRPDHNWQIASCAVLNDMSLHVWDIRRPHIQVTSFTGHCDSLTDIWWSKCHPHRFVSAGKDSLLVLHSVADGESTLEHLCDAPIDVAPDGMIAIAANADDLYLKNESKWDHATSAISTLQLRPDKISHARRRALAIARRQNAYDPFRGPVKMSVCTGLPDTAKNSMQPLKFDQLATEYRVGGARISELCEINANAASAAGEEAKANTWRHIAVIIAQTNFQEVLDKAEKDLKEAELHGYESYLKEQASKGIRLPTYPCRKPSLPLAVLQCPRYPAAGQMEKVTILGRERRNSKQFDSLNIEKQSDLTSGEFYFGPCELRGAEAIDSEEPLCDEFMGLPAEAFELKPSKSHLKYSSLANMTEEDDWLPKEGGSNWNALEVLSRTLNYLAEQGDIQMCATAAVVCGSELLNVISDYKVETWVQSYLEMLDRLELFTTAAAIYKYTALKTLTSKTTEGTFIREEFLHLREPRLVEEACNFSLINGLSVCAGNVRRGRCDKCWTVAMPQCVLCDEVIRGALWSCLKCCHTMHVDHAILWFKGSSDEDPAEYRLGSGDRFIHPKYRSCPVSWCWCKCNVEQNEEMDRKVGQGLLSPIRFVETSLSRTIRRYMDSLMKKVNRSTTKTTKSRKQYSLTESVKMGHRFSKNMLENGPMEWEKFSRILESLRTNGSSEARALHNLLVSIQFLGEDISRKNWRFIAKPTIPDSDFQLPNPGVMSEQRKAAAERKLLMTYNERNAHRSVRELTHRSKSRKWQESALARKRENEAKSMRKMAKKNYTETDSVLSVVEELDEEDEIEEPEIFLVIHDSDDDSDIEIVEDSDDTVEGSLPSSHYHPVAGNSGLVALNDAVHRRIFGDNAFSPSHHDFKPGSSRESKRFEVDYSEERRELLQQFAAPSCADLIPVAVKMLKAAEKKQPPAVPVDPDSSRSTRTAPSPATLGEAAISADEASCRICHESTETSLNGDYFLSPR